MSAYVPPMTELSRRFELLMVVALLGAGTLFRAGVAMRNPLPAGDGVASDLEMARNVPQGLGFSTMRKWILFDASMAPLRPEGNRQPAMSVLEAGVFALTGPSFPAVQCMSVLLGIGCLLAAWAWARRNLGPAAAILMLGWLSFDPLFVWYSTQPDGLMAYTALVFLCLIVAGVDSIGIRRAAVLGLLAGVAWLVRTQAGLLAASLGLWVLIRGRRKLASAAVFAAVLLVVVSPWLWRNWRAFGSPLFTYSRIVLLAENHWAAWEVRSTAPGPMDLLRHQDPGAVLMHLTAGFLRVIEPFTTGTLHRGEVFGQPSLAAFAAAGVLALADRGVRRRLLLPAIVSAATMAALVVHDHPGRYMSFITAFVVAVGFAGLRRLPGLAGAGRWITVTASAVLFLPLLRPSALLLGRDDRPRAAEAAEVSGWIAEHSSPSDWVVTFPNVEELIWQYRRPTLTMPNDYEMLLWPCLERHGVRYVVVDPDLPALRPWLSSRWRRGPDGSAWETIDPPPFLAEVYRSSSGRTIVYEWTGRVPDGFMAVDSLPRDNCRALAPGVLSR
jgi:hypothetical protein